MKTILLLPIMTLTACSSLMPSKDNLDIGAETVQCQPGDDDGDGVDNCDDRCPGTILSTGQYVNIHGCPFQLHDGMDETFYFPRRGDMPNEDAKNKALLARTVKMVETFSTTPGLKIALVGHTDNCDDEESNLKLSLRRAENVRQQLIAAGVPAHMIASASGEGSNRPRSSAGPACSNPFNDRVNIEAAGL